MKPRSAVKTKRPEIWSFFSGAMGLDLGFEAAGLQPTLAVEIDPTCCATIRTNRPGLTVIEGSVSDLNGPKLRTARSFERDVFLMIGGPPCQSFSSGGKRAALSDPRGNLIYEYMRLISEVRPRFFVLENVANLITAALRHRPINLRPGKHWNLKAYETGRFNGCDDAAPLDPDEMSGTAIRQLLKDLGTLGYHATFGVLDAADHGSAQHRLRLVMLASRDGEHLSLPTATHGPFSSTKRPYRTVRDAIADLANSPGPHSEYTERFKQYFAVVPEGKNWRALPERIQKEALGAAYESGGGKTGFFRRLAWDAPAPTVTGRANRKASAACHPADTRPLSVKECARLQGFPDDWIFCGSMAAQYLQVGNAVPVDLGRAVGSIFSQHLDQRRRHTVVAAETSERMLERAVQRLRASARNKNVRITPPSLPFEECQA